MKTYEITFITREEPKESSVKKDIENLNGRILSISNMGQKTFVYPIEKEKSGFYTTYIFEMEPEKLQDFSRKLGLGEEILRHLIVSLSPSEVLAKFPVDGKVAEIALTPETELMVEPEMALEIEPEKTIEEVKIEEPVVEETIVEEKVEEPKKEAKKTVKKVEKAEVKETKVREEVKTEKPKKAEKEKIEKPAKKEVETEVEEEEERLEALDKKLEELLKD
ncbi:MAG: 30S ribosomal protein S6 [Candidatus Berkelbacteria bacterium]